MAATRINPGLLSSIATGLDPTAKMAAQAVSGFLPSMKQARQEEMEKERQRQKLLTLNAYERGLSNVDTTAEQRANVLSGMLQLGTEQKIDFTPEDIRDLRTRSKETRKSLTEEEKKKTFLKNAGNLAKSKKLAPETVKIIEENEDIAKTWVKEALRNPNKENIKIVESEVEQENGELHKIVSGINKTDGTEEWQLNLGQVPSKPMKVTQAQQVFSQSIRDDIQESKANISKYERLAKQMEDVGFVGGFFNESVTELAAKLGMGDLEYIIKQELTNIRVNQALAFLPPGAASDKDVELVLSGQVDIAKLNVKDAAAYLRGLAILARGHEKYSQAKSAWLAITDDYALKGFDQWVEVKHTENALMSMQEIDPVNYKLLEEVFETQDEQGLQEIKRIQNETDPQTGELTERAEFYKNYETVFNDYTTRSNTVKTIITDRHNKDKVKQLINIMESQGI